MNLKRLSKITDSKSKIGLAVQQALSGLTEVYVAVPRYVQGMDAHVQIRKDGGDLAGVLRILKSIPNIKYSRDADEDDEFHGYTITEK